MADGDCGESSSESATEEPDTYIESLRLRRAEYRAVLDHQIQWASRIDTKAIRTSQIILVLLGILVSVSQITRQPPLSEDLLTVGGLIALFVAFVLGVFTYSVTGLHSGPGGGYGTDVVTKTPPERQWLESLGATYTILPTQGLEPFMSTETRRSARLVNGPEWLVGLFVDSKKADDRNGDE